ncbi:MAG: hypothetical protein HUJ75_03445 [Parasporobacterium sp.]|nr:hypothetical protein [Parasporobacterium sp.]
MKKRVKQILAIIAIVIILGLYITTLILAVTGNESTDKLFTLSIAATIVVPGAMYIFSWIYKKVHSDAEEGR